MAREFTKQSPPLPRATADKGGDTVHGKEEEEKEVIGKLFGVLPIDQLVTPYHTVGGFCGKI